MEKYLVKHIWEQDFGCEGKTENKPTMLDLHLETLDAYREEKKISVLESELKRKEINEGEVVVFNPQGELLKSGVLVNPMQLILEHSKTDIEKIESIYCADTGWFEVTIIINDEEKLILEVKNSIAGVNLSGLEKIKNLQKLDCAFDWAINVDSISDLLQLTELRIISANVSSLEFVKKLNKLKVLNLRRTRKNDDIFDISEIINLPELENLCLSCRKIMDISYLSELRNLKELVLGTCGIEDVILMKTEFIQFLNRKSGLDIPYFSDSDVTNIYRTGVLSSFTKISAVLWVLDILYTGALWSSEFGKVTWQELYSIRDIGEFCERHLFFCVLCSANSICDTGRNINKVYFYQRFKET